MGEQVRDRQTTDRQTDRRVEEQNEQRQTEKQAGYRVNACQSKVYQNLRTFAASAKSIPRVAAQQVRAQQPPVAGHLE